MSEEIEFHTANLERSMYDLLVAFPSRDLPKFVDQQFKGVMATIIDLTPPGSRGVKGVAARRQGEETLTADIVSVFRVVPAKGAPKGVDMKSEHFKRRIRRGRAAGVANYADRPAVTQARLDRYVRERKKFVGTLASGWRPAASLFKIPLAAWVARNNGSGSARKFVNDHRIAVTATNAVSYASKVGMYKRMNVALGAQTNKIRRRLKHLFDQSVRRTGLKVTA